MSRDTSLLVLGAKSNEPGGVENVVSNLDFQLRMKGIEVTTLNIPPMSHKLFWTLKPVWSIQPYLRSLTRNFDLVHGHGDNCLFYSLFRTKKIPFIVTSHGTQPLNLLSQGHSNRAERWYLSLPEVIAGRKCDVVVAVSKGAKDELMKYYGLAAEKIRVIYNGVDTTTFTPGDKSAARKKLGLPSTGPFGLWVGKAPIRKGLDIAIASCERAGCRLLVRGSTRGNSKSIISLGKISQNLMPQVYNAADFLIHPSRYEAGPPLVCFEALACGVPIIASESSKAGELIQDGTEGFIVKDRDIAGFARRVSSLVDSPQLCENMGQEARVTASGYDWKGQTEKYIALYEEVLSNS